MKDIAPELLDQIQNDFDAELKKNKRLTALQKLLDDGKATYEDALEYATETGRILSEAFQKNLSSDVLPDGKLYYNIANRIIPPSMKKAFDKIADYSCGVQKTLNKNAGIGVKAIKPSLNEDRVTGIVDIVSGKEYYDDVAYMLKEDKVINICQNIVDETIKANVAFHFKAGLQPKITRKLKGKGCVWCRQVAGTYNYPDVPKDVYRRHDHCNCVVTYIPTKGKAQTVHSGTEGKRKYVKEEYGGYELTKEERIKRSKERAATEKERKELARQKRIATWEKKKSY